MKTWYFWRKIYKIHIYFVFKNYFHHWNMHFGWKSNSILVFCVDCIDSIQYSNNIFELCLLLAVQMSWLTVCMRCSLCVPLKVRVISFLDFSWFSSSKKHIETFDFPFFCCCLFHPTNASSEAGIGLFCFETGFPSLRFYFWSIYLRLNFPFLSKSSRIQTASGEAKGAKDNRTGWERER